MAESKGMFIILACSLLKTKPQAQAAAAVAVKKLTGKSLAELDPDGWYNTRVIESVLQSIQRNSPALLADAAIRFIGHEIYPAVRELGGIPEHLNTPMELLRFEAEGFIQNHRGENVRPRQFIEEKNGKVVIEANSPGYNCLLAEGVYTGILDMCGVRNGRVMQTKCRQKGHQHCEYTITWEPSSK